MARARASLEREDRPALLPVSRNADFTVVGALYQAAISIDNSASNIAITLADVATLGSEIPNGMFARLRVGSPGPFTVSIAPAVAGQMRTNPGIVGWNPNTNGPVFLGFSTALADEAEFIIFRWSANFWNVVGPCRVAAGDENGIGSGVGGGPLGTAAVEDVGTAVGNVVQLEDVGGGTPGMPAVDGSQLTGLPGGGDMVAAVYDPQAIAGDAFARANHTGGQAASTITSGTFADARISESSVVQHQGAIEVTLAQVGDAGSAAGAEIADFATAAQGALADSALQSPVDGSDIASRSITPALMDVPDEVTEIGYVLTVTAVDENDLPTAHSYLPATGGVDFSGADDATDYTVAPLDVSSADYNTERRLAQTDVGTHTISFTDADLADNDYFSWLKVTTTAGVLFEFVGDDTTDEEVSLVVNGTLFAPAAAVEFFGFGWGRYDATARIVYLNGDFAVPVDFVGQLVSGNRVEQEIEAGASYTFVAADTGKAKRLSHSTTITATVPDDLPVGWAVEWEQVGAGEIVFTEDTGTTIENWQGHVESGGQWATGALRCVSNSDGSSAVVVLSGATVASA